MSIEINGITKTKAGEVNSTSLDAPRSPLANPGKAENSPASVVTDQISLTPTGLQMSALAKKLNEIPEVDQDKVNAVRDAIANGTYKIDADSIAKKLIQTELSLHR